MNESSVFILDLLNRDITYAFSRREVWEQGKGSKIKKSDHVTY